MRVVIAEDAALFRQGLASLLADCGHRVCAAVADPGALLAAVAEHHPDAAIVDVRMPPPHTDEGLRAALTPREREVLTLMAEGRSNAGIASTLVVSSSVVEKHVARVFDKLGLSSSEADNRRVMAVLRYLSSLSGFPPGISASGQPERGD